MQTGDTSFVTIPSKLGEEKNNSEIIVGTLGLRFGLNDVTEFYSRASYLSNRQRYIHLSSQGEESKNQFSSAWIGITHQISEDNTTPAFLAFAESSIYEKFSRNSATWKSWAFGFITYRAIDPVVLALTTTYQWNQKRNHRHLAYKPGNLLFISPSVAFAVNDRVTLTTGFQWKNSQTDKYEGTAIGYRQTNMGIMLGLGYGFAEGSIINISFIANNSGKDQSILRASYLYTL